MSATYPKPETPLPWKQGVFANHVDDWAYAVYAANALPHLVAALELFRYAQYLPTHAIVAVNRALAIARGEITP